MLGMGTWGSDGPKTTSPSHLWALPCLVCFAGVGARWDLASALTSPVPSGRGNAAGIGHGWREATGKVTVTGSAASSVLQAVLGLFSSRRSSLSASLVSRTFPKGRSVAFSTGLIFSHRFSLNENSFLKVCIPCPFSQDTAIETCILFLTATGHEGTKYNGCFIVPPCSVSTESKV